jgi:hypothetical protein
MSAQRIYFSRKVLSRRLEAGSTVGPASSRPKLPWIAIMGRNCPTTLLNIDIMTTLLNIDIITIVTIVTIITIMAGSLFGFAGQGMALPVWPVTEDPNGKPVTEDRIGYEDGSYLEFMDFSLDPNAVIEYRIGDAWVGFPHRLNCQKRTPHTVHILFEVSVAARDAQNLVLAAKTDAPITQRLGIFLDGRPIHHQGGEEIQPDPSFQEHTFWLGYMTRGNHRITLSNVTDPASTSSDFGIYFDYLKLVPGATVGISLAADAKSTAVIKDFMALESHDSAISGSVLPRAHFYAGFWRLRITGLEPGAGVKVEIHCPPEPFFALQEYYTHDGSDSSDSSNSSNISNSSGPECGWEAMKIAKDPASSTVTVELYDGGVGDADLTPDGSISHIGGIAVPFSLSGGYDYQGCFIVSLKQKQKFAY